MAHEHDLIDPRGIRTCYELTPSAKAETILCACSAGGGLTKELGDFLAGARASGLVGRLMELLGDLNRLSDSSFIFGADGRAIRIHRAAEDDSSVSLEVEQFVGGKPKGRTYFPELGLELAEHPSTPRLALAKLDNEGCLPQLAEAVSSRTTWVTIGTALR